MFYFDLLKLLWNLKIIPLNPFDFSAIHSEGINFSLGQLNILRTFYIPSAVGNGKPRERVFTSRFRRYGATHIEGQDKQKQ